MGRNTTPPPSDLSQFAYGTPPSIGFHAKKERADILGGWVPERVERTVREWSPEFGPDLLREEREVPVVGQVECIGHIIEGEAGYRSQGMVIRALDVAPQDADLIPYLEARYQCPVTTADVAHSLVRAHITNLYASLLNTQSKYLSVTWNP